MRAYSVEHVDDSLVGVVLDRERGGLVSGSADLLCELVRLLRVARDEGYAVAGLSEQTTAVRSISV